MAEVDRPMPSYWLKAAWEECALNLGAAVDHEGAMAGSGSSVKREN